MRNECWLALTLLASACAQANERESSDPTTGTPASLPANAAAAEQVLLTGEINPRVLRRFQPIVGQGGSATITEEKVTLGRMLYFEKRLSKGQDVSCNSCHDLEKFGVDGLATSVGHKRQTGTRNAPTVYNAALHIAQFWDGRADTVEQQATGPIVNPVEMASSERHVVDVLSSMPRYVELFRAAYPGTEQPITLANVGDAIGAFERGLTTRSRWDDFIAGKNDALTQEEKQGLRTFLSVGCMACHTGPQVGASMYQRVGVIEPWPNLRDQGRYDVTKVTGDKMIFKVPSMKNIAETGPYFHDGSAAKLEDAIRLMGRHQVGMELTDEEIKSIATWMGSLTGKVDPAFIAPPELPPSDPRTPKPQID
jgi:cytochrome c peroxidase